MNPLAEREYAEEAREHVTELSEQRKDLEAAITELRALIRRTDREIAAAFEETFEATARGLLFPPWQAYPQEEVLADEAVIDVDRSGARSARR